MIRHILKAQGHKVGVIGTVHIMIGDTSYPIHNTTPDVVDLQHILHQMVQENVEYCVMEVSSHALALGRVSGVEFDTAVFTNLTQDHWISTKHLKITWLLNVNCLNKLVQLIKKKIIKVLLLISMIPMVIALWKKLRPQRLRIVH